MSRTGSVVGLCVVAALLAAATPSGAVAAPVGTGESEVMAVVASADEVSVVAGSSIHLHVTVVNTGPATLHEVTVAEGSVPGCAVAPFDLALGEARTVDCTHEVGDDDVGVWSYSAEVSAAGLEAPVVSNPVSVTVLAAVPALAVVASAAETAVVEGDDIHLRITVVNTGNLVLRDVAVAEGAAPGCAVAAFDLAVGAVRTITCATTTTEQDATAGSWGYTASVSAAALADPVLSNDVVVEVAAASPSLTVVASAEEASVVPGETIHLRFEVTNTGNVTLHDLVLQAAAAPSCAVEPFDLAAGAVEQVDCEVVTTTSGVGPFALIAEATARELDQPVASNEVIVQIDEVPNLSVVVAVDRPAVVSGESVEVSVAVVNTGNVVLHGVGVSGVGVAGCDEVEPFELGVGAQVVVECGYVTTDDDLGTVTFGATVVADELDAPLVAEEVEVEVAAQAPALSVVVAVDRPAVVSGESVEVSVAVVNTGNVVLHGVGVSGVGVAGCDEVEPFELGVGAQVVVECGYVTTDDDLGTVTFGATVVADELDAPLVAEEVEVEVAAQAPALTAVMTVLDPAVVVGARIDARVVVVNTGNVALRNVEVSDWEVGETGCADPTFDLLVGADQVVECHRLTTTDDLGLLALGAIVAADELAGGVPAGPVEVMVLRRWGTVAGQVSDAVTELPVEGALVALLAPANFDTVAIGETDADGRYELPARIGRYYLFVVDPSLVHRGRFHGDPSPVTVGPEQVLSVDVALDPTRGSFSGRVTASDGGAPIEDVLVVGLDVGGADPAPGAVTAADGSYTVSGLIEGQNHAMFVDLAGAYSPEYHDDARSVGDAVPISIAGGADTGEVDAALDDRLVVDHDTTLTGTVTGVDGEPLSGIAVVGLSPADFGFETGVVTDGSGHYVLDLPEGDHMVTFYDTLGRFRQSWFDGRAHPALHDADLVSTSTDAPAVADGVLVSARGTLSGTVSDAVDGAPVAGMVAAAVHPQRGVSGMALTEGDGTYQIDDLRAGTYRVRVLSTDGSYGPRYFGGGPGFDSADPVVVEGAEDTPDVDVEIDPVVDVDPLLAEALLLLRADSVGTWDGSGWPNEGTGGPGLDAALLAEAVTFLPASEPDGPGFLIPAEVPGGGRDGDDGFAVPGAGALAESMGGSFTFTVAFTPIYTDPNTVRFYRKYTGSSIVESQTGFVIEDSATVHGLIVALCSACEQDTGNGVALSGLAMDRHRQVLTMRVDRAQDQVTVVRNGLVVAELSAADLDDVTDNGALTIGPGQVSHLVAWHDRALTDNEIEVLHGRL